VPPISADEASLQREVVSISLQDKKEIQANAKTTSIESTKKNKNVYLPPTTSKPVEKVVQAPCENPSVQFVQPNCMHALAAENRVHAGGFVEIRPPPFYPPAEHPDNAYFNEQFPPMYGDPANRHPGVVAATKWGVPPNFETELNGMNRSGVRFNRPNKGKQQAGEAQHVPESVNMVSSTGFQSNKPEKPTALKSGQVNESEFPSLPGQSSKASHKEDSPKTQPLVSSWSKIALKAVSLETESNFPPSKIAQNAQALRFDAKEWRPSTQGGLQSQNSRKAW